MGILFSVFFNKLLGKNISADAAATLAKVIFFVLFVVAVVAAIYIGHRDYQALVTENASLKQQVTTVTQDLEDQIKTNKQLTSSAKTDVSAVSKNDNAHAKADTKKTTVVTKKREKIAQIEKSYESKPQTAQTQVDEEREVSTVQVDSLWELYCQSESLKPDNSSCGVAQSPPAAEPKTGDQT
jgi:cell division protein FtsL